MLPDAFARFADGVARRDTESLWVVRNGKLVHEWHDWGNGRRTRHDTASMAKAVVGGLSLAVLAAEGRLSLDTAAAVRVPRWRDDPTRSRITLRQLATHSSGLANATPADAAGPEASGWKAEFWRRDGPRTPIDVAVEDTPLVFAPGRGFGYSNPGFAVLSQVLAAALRGSPEPTLPDFLRDRIFRPIGVPDGAWSIGYARPFHVEGLETWAVWGGGRLSSDALARIGRLILRRGDWDGRRVLPADAIEALVGYAGTPLDPRWPAPTLGGFNNARGAWPRLPRDAFVAFGAGQKVLLVVPSLDLVVVRLGGPLDPDAAADDFWGPLERLLLDPLMQAFPAPPVAHSEVLGGAWFDPPASLACSAQGSDNWPITALRDGSLFAAYGDGRGFEPFVARKLSLGFARITGGPAGFRGVNVRSDGEREGDGPAGPKASGMLALDGAIYMWVRNLGNSRLAWSHDEGRTWTWGFTFQQSFGSPTFLNFGPDYAGARDDFVYVYSQDGPSAYQADDRVILARVPRRRIREESAYEFFAGRDAAGQPRWSPDRRDRVGTLEQRAGCRRSEVVFDAGLGRYLMTLGFDAEGGWGIFEAPEPWGPWRSVYTTRRWDLGATHSYRLPTAWIGDGGRSLHLVVSGRDARGTTLDGFCVRPLRILPLAVEAAR